ncbi:hypothetical protein ACJ3XI_01405 [Litorimonas sp. RW-G-Af-16]|uniref:hypothetical protein n=1 Tax=Litorimonas sp. RW-G-Af-16 TaxID=3241168 RepID=UPI00390CCBEA
MMTDQNNDPTTGIDLDKQPHKSILKRIDLGLATGMCALLISFVGIVTSRATFKMNQETQKARVLPIIDVDMGYENIGDRSEAAFVVRLNNVGAGIAHIQRVTPLKNGEPVTTLQEFEDTIMNRRMRSNIGYPVVAPAAGFLAAGKSVTPRRYRMGAAGSELGAYLRGEYGVPMDGLDIDVCYCSVFSDCWTVKYLDKKLPKPVDSCGIDDAPEDMFQTYIDQTAAKRLEQ